MASALFDPGREGFLDGSIDWDTDDIRAMLVAATYSFSAAHRFVSDLGAVDVGRSASLGSKTVTNGVADAADTSIAASSATQVGFVVIFKHTGADGTARLIAKIDMAAFTPANGQTVNLVFDSGSNRIFKL